MKKNYGNKIKERKKEWRDRTSENGGYKIREQNTRDRIK